jgi:hypothetical protein
MRPTHSTPEAPLPESFTALFKVVLIWPGTVGIAIGLRWISMAFRPIPQNTGITGFEIAAILIVALVEAVAVPVALFKLLRRREFRNRRNVAATLVAIVGALPGTFALLGMWALAGGDWA